MQFTQLPESHDTMDMIPRHKGNGAPKIYPRDFDPAPVQAWIDGGCKGDPPKGGKFYTRTTTFIDVLDDKANIAKWKVRKTLEGVASLNPDDLEVLREHDNLEGSESKRWLDTFAERMQKAAGSELRSTLGTAIHEVTEDYDSGLDVGSLPPEIERDLDAYINATEGMDMTAIEQFVVNDNFQYAGTADRFITLWGEWANQFGVPEGTQVVGDLKTGSSVDFSRGKFPMQMAAYANAMEYNPYTLERVESGCSTEVGILIHLPAGEGWCKVYKMDLTRGWSDVQLAYKVREYRKHWASKKGEFPLISSVEID